MTVNIWTYTCWHEIGCLNNHVSLKFEKRLSNFRVIRQFKTHISQRWHFMRFGDISYWLKWIGAVIMSSERMMTSSNGNTLWITGLCVGNSLVTGEFSTQRPATWSFDVFFDLRLNKRLSKQSWGWWFEMPWRSLWHHCNGVNSGNTSSVVL